MIPAKVVVSTLAALSVIFASQAITAKPFYKGKRVTMLINYNPGGGADRSGRVIGRHLPRLIEGNPKIIFKNYPGAGGLKAINYMGEVAKPDGLMVTNFSGGYNYQMLKDPALRTDLTKMNWIAGVGGTSIIYVRKDTKPGLKNPIDIWNVKDRNHFKVAGFRITGTKDIRERLSFQMLKVKFKPVTGFKGTTKSRTALLQNEVQAFGDSRAAWFKTIVPNMVDTGIVMPLYHYDHFNADGTVSGYSDLASIPTLSELYKQKFGKAPSGMEWKAIRWIQTLQGIMVRNTMLAPGAPKAAVKAMRQAYAKLAKDPLYLADAKKSLGFTPEFVDGETVADRLKWAINDNKGVQKWLLAQIEIWKSKK